MLRIPLLQVFTLNALYQNIICCMRYECEVLGRKILLSLCKLSESYLEYIFKVSRPQIALYHVSLFSKLNLVSKMSIWCLCERETVCVCPELTVNFLSAIYVHCGLRVNFLPSSTWKVLIQVKCLLMRLTCVKNIHSLVQHELTVRNVIFEDREQYD